MKIETIPIEVKIIKFNFSFHKTIKKELLNEIDKVKKIDLKRNPDQTRISYCDWDNRKDFNRNWYKLIKIPLSIAFTQTANQLNFFNYLLQDIWYQQYEKNDCHNWHIHSDNYTGVYYVEYDKNCKTELYDSVKNKKFYLEAKEGDLVFFPSFIIHRSPMKKESKRKTIISWNLNFELIDNDFFNKLNEIK